jgi:hypothetical protein
MGIGQYIDNLLGLFLFTQGHGDPCVFEHVRYLPEKSVYFLKTVREQLVDTLFDGILVSEVVNLRPHYPLFAVHDGLSLQTQWLKGLLCPFFSCNALSIELIE